MKQYHNPNKGAVKLAQNYTEYASNDGSGGTAAGITYDTGMVYGEEGANVVAVVSNIPTTYAATKYRVTFRNAILPTDTLILEFSSGDKWIKMWPLIYQGQACYGAVIMDIPEDPKSIYVAFGNAGVQSTTVSGYATTSINPWSGSTSMRWRVRKVSTGNFAESPQVNPSITVTGDYTVQHGIETVNVSASEASILLDSMIPSDRVTIRKLGNDATKYITITPPAGTTIEGRSELRLYGQYSYAILERVSETVFVVVDLKDEYVWDISTGAKVRRRWGQLNEKEIITLTPSPAGSSRSILHGLDVEKIVSFSGSFYYSSSGNRFPFGFISNDGTRGANIGLYVNSTAVVLEADVTLGAAYTILPCVITIWYKD